jgi:hypothetical protein
MTLKLLHDGLAGALSPKLAGELNTGSEAE